MSFTDRVREWQNRPGNETKDSDQIMTEIYNSQESRIRDLRKDLKDSKARERKPISVDLNSSGELYLKSKSYDKNLQANSVATRVLVKSSVLGDLDNLLTPLLEASKAIYAAGGLLNESIRTTKDSNGNYTRTPLKDRDGEDLYQVNPISRFKMICWILENNDQAKQAVKTISEVLKDYTKDNLQEMAVVKSETKSTKPIKPTPLQRLEAAMHKNALAADQSGKGSKSGSDSPAGD